MRRTRPLLLLGTLLAVCGGLLIAWPHLQIQREQAAQDELVRRWERELSVLEAPIHGTDGEERATPEVNPESPVPAAMLRIDAIDLVLPILEGTTPEHLAIALTTIEPTCRPGETGCFAVAGHNSLDDGRNFNRLDEVREGDRVVIETMEGSFAYTVTELLVVEPDETGVLLGEPGRKTLALVTCTPRDRPEKRLVVRGELD